MEMYALSKVEDVIAELDDVCDEYHIVELDEVSRLELDGERVYVPEWDLTLVSGVVSMLNEATGEFEPDFSVTAFYEGQDFEYEDWLYYEQDGMPVALHNYLRAQEYDLTGHSSYEGDCLCCILKPGEEYVGEEEHHG